MTHPDGSLLVDLLDGALSPEEAAPVREHLATCRNCREEVGFASSASRALASLPERPVPAGVARDAIRQAHLAATTEGRKRPSPVGARGRLTYRLVGAAVAAAVVGLAAVGLSSVLHDSASRLGNAPLLESSSTPGAEHPYDTDGNYTPPELVALADRFAGSTPAPQLAAGVGGATPPSASTADSPVPSAQSHASNLGTLPPLPKTAKSMSADSPGWMVGTSCLTSAGVFDKVSATLKYLVQAKYEGEPAWIGVVLENPVVGQLPDRVVVWAVSRQGCSVLSFAQAML